MIDTKLILVEGIPGAGKTTITQHLGAYLQHRGIRCRWYLEEDHPHPIACHEMKLKDLAEALPPQWAAFVERASHAEMVTIIESRLWQNTLLFMFMDDYPLDEILACHQLVWKELQPLAPALIVLYHDDIEKAMHRLSTLRSPSMIEKDLEATRHYKWFQRRGLQGMDGWVQFFGAWQAVAERLYGDWPYWKTKIDNPHDDSERARQKVYRFLQERKISPTGRRT
jgi:thymidylate kinase